ncbi:MAG: tryptophan--tRNA ligase, partial [Limnothrix sp.]
AECADMGWGQFKPLLTDTVVTALEPIQTKYNELTADKTYLDQVLRDGRIQAEEVANTTLARVKDALGFLPSL